MAAQPSLIDGKPLWLEEATRSGQILQEQAGGSGAVLSEEHGVCAAAGARAARISTWIRSAPVPKARLERDLPYVSCVSVEMYLLALSEC